MSEPEDPDMLAAEYVLGTLEAAERTAVAARLGTDPNLSRAVQAWEDRLAPLLDQVPAIGPPPELGERIAVRLFGPMPQRSTTEPGGGTSALQRQLRCWQGAAAGFALMAASLLAWIVLHASSTSAGRERFTAVLQRDAGAPVMLIDVDLVSRRLTVRPLAAAAPAGRAYELWIIDPALGTPRSLGVLPAHADAERSLGAFGPSVIAGATYAVTLEPLGGSPTGQPSAAPVLAGKLSDS